MSLSRLARRAALIVAPGGDTLVLLRAVVQCLKDGRLYRNRAAMAFEGSSSGFSEVSGDLAAEGDTSTPSINLLVSFPGSAPGEFEVTAADNASITWIDLQSGKAYQAIKGSRGVSGHISIVRCASDVIVGSFSGNLGYWAPPAEPMHDPPTEVIAVTNGHIKYSGKIIQSRTGSPRS